MLELMRVSEAKIQSSEPLNIELFVKDRKVKLVLRVFLITEIMMNKSFYFATVKFEFRYLQGKTRRNLKPPYDFPLF